MNYKVLSAVPGGLGEEDVAAIGKVRAGERLYRGNRVSGANFKTEHTVEEQKESFNLLMQDIEYLQHYNIFIVIDKCVIIDFEASCRKKVEKKYFRIRGVHETMLESDRE